MRPEERAAYDLCLYVGVIHPDELRARLTSRQWAGWLAYLRHYPLPHDRADINTALTRASVLRYRHPEKLLPPYGRPRRGKSEAELKAVVAQHLAATAAAKAKRGQGKK